MSKIEIIDKSNLRTLKAAVEKELRALGTKYGVAFAVTGGHFSNGNTGDLKVEVALVKGKGGKSAADILGAEQWKTYAKQFGLDPKLLGKTFEYKGVTCTIKGIQPTRHKYPVRVDMGGKEKLFPVDTVLLYSDPKALAKHQKLTAGWQKPGRRSREM